MPACVVATVRFGACVVCVFVGARYRIMHFEPFSNVRNESRYKRRFVFVSVFFRAVFVTFSVHL